MSSNRYALPDAAADSTTRRIVSFSNRRRILPTGKGLLPAILLHSERARMPKLANGRLYAGKGGLGTLLS
jgi:hypothetical protein